MRDVCAHDCVHFFFPTIEVRLTELPELNLCATPSVPPYLTKHGVEQRANPWIFLMSSESCKLATLVVSA